MNLDQIAARLRPRTPYEALDLGFALAQRFFKPIALAWIACVLPLVVGVALVCALTPAFWVPLAVLWWLKPLYDRAALFVLSRAFFGDVPSVGRAVHYTLRSWLSLSALADLTWRRFSPYRGLTMPVRELEQQRGAAAKERLDTLLNSKVQTPAAWMCLVGFGTVWTFVAAAVIFFGITVPGTVDVDLSYRIAGLFEADVHDPFVEVPVLLAYAAAMSVVEIFFVAGSFGLYINRRVRLEGWDIEIVFRRMAKRLAARASEVARAAVGLVLAIAVGLGAAPSDAVAQEATGDALGDYSASATEQAAPQDGLPDREAEPTEYVPERAPAEVAREVLSAPEFGSTSTETEWVPRDDLLDDSEQEEPADQSGDKSAVVGGVAAVMEVVMWVLAAVIVLGALYFFFRKGANLELAGASDEDDKVGARADLEAVEPSAEPVTLPADLVRSAIAQWRDGEYEASLSVLYRGTIDGLAEGYGIEIDDSMTARECARRVREAGGPGEYVTELAAAWTATVYADRRPSDAQAQRLFDSWKHHFAGQSA